MKPFYPYNWRRENIDDIEDVPEKPASKKIPKQLRGTIEKKTPVVVGQHNHITHKYGWRTIESLANKQQIKILDEEICKRIIEMQKKPANKIPYWKLKKLKRQNEV